MTLLPKLTPKHFCSWFASVSGQSTLLLLGGGLIVLDLILKTPFFDRFPFHEPQYDWKDLFLAVAFAWILLQSGRRVKREAGDRAFLTAMVRSAPDAIIGFNNAGILHGWNRGAEEIFGYSAAEMIGRPFTHYLEAVVPKDLWDDSLRRMERMREERSVSQVETRRVRKDGREIQVSMTLTAILDARGMVIGQGGIIRDVTEKKKAEEAYRKQEAQLKVAQKVEAIGQLAGGVAHDFNNLLVVVRGNSEALLEGPYAQDRGREELLEIQEAARRGSELTRQLLAFSNKQAVKPQPVNLNELAVSMNNMLHRLIYDHIEMYLFQGKDLGYVLGDPTQLEQILLNLVINARDAMSNGGHLLIETQNVVRDAKDAGSAVPPGSYVRLSVKDTGHGMGEEVRQRIFDPFFTTKGERGTGLGLATVHQIVQRMGGHIVVQSEPGIGTEFSLYFPACDPPAAVKGGTSCLPLETKGTETILVAEDDPSVRRVLARILQGSGYQVLEAGNGQEALRVSDDHQGAIDLLMTDVMMPKMGGRELAEILVERRPEARVLFISGYPSDVLSAPGGVTGDIPLFFKPFSSAALAEKVREILDGVRL